MNKRGGDDREYINGHVQYRIQMVGSRDKLNLNNPADWLAAMAKVFAEDTPLYQQWRKANSIRVGKISLTD